jgi:hypothetical protein
VTAILRILVVGLVAVSGVPAVARAQVPTGRPPQDLFRGDVHARAGLTCESCHGQPSAGRYAEIKRTAIAPLCAHCHADPEYMHRFKPKVPVDQYTQYLSSTHGKQMAKGETRVATCTDCHGAHGVAAGGDPKSPVAVLRVAVTCARCHSDQKLMDEFEHTDAPADWKTSAHAAALRHGDTSAPTCSTCHSSHGALPAGAAKLDEVCWQCHAREAELYKASPKKKIFDENDHPGCVTCHENHTIVKGSDSDMAITGPGICASCHDAEMKGAGEIALVRHGLDQLTADIDRAGRVLDRAERVGMLVDEGADALRDAREHQIQARVSVHTFTVKPFRAVAGPGIKAATRAETIAHDALHDLQLRRRGLLVATLLIVGFLATLYVKIRRLPPVTDERTT